MATTSPGNRPVIVKTTGEALRIAGTADKPAGTLQTGGFDSTTRTLHLGHAIKGHPRGVSATGGDANSPTLAGITVFFCEDGRVFWANDSFSLPRGVTLEEARAIQLALEQTYADHTVVQVVRIGDVPK